jgi:hypothetical protein
MTKEEILKTIHVGDFIYLVNNMGQVFKREIEEIDQNSIRFNFCSQDNRARANLELGYCNLHISYAKQDKYYFFFTKQDAATFKREIVKKTMNEIISKCESSWSELKEFRKKHFEILNSPDIDKWIEEFENNKNW